MFSKILVANRGEIAVRIIRTCKRMGIKTVAVYSEADKNALHTRLADEIYCIGPARPDQSYLSIPNVLSVAEAAKCDAIHPGYGFLSENPNFAEIVEKCGFTFIGPDFRAIERMGQKSVARELMQKNNIPVVPGSPDSIEDAREGLQIAKQVGFPVLIKATSGGGGKGMRLVEKPEDFASMFDMAKAEAQASFGDSRVYIEKFITNPRHIEVQIAGDTHGTVVALGERECTIQRRHQKLLEECPSPAVSPALRKKLCETAIRAAELINYYSLGTVEFLLDGNDNFYFMEMNTRLQVEHPITELATGLDLVEMQIRIANGEKLNLPYKIADLKGWAIECRINAESPLNSFAPSPGTLETYIAPGGPWVRVDSSAYQEYEIAPEYDSMIAKLIVWGNNREEAINRMLTSLSEFTIKGVDTTIPFHEYTLNTDTFRSGNFNTSFVAQHMPDFLMKEHRKQDMEAAAE